jgi:hypothetical protein
MRGQEKNTWEQRFGAKRRAIDCALLGEAERQIAREERAAPIPPVDRDTERRRIDRDAERRRIALAFGRPLA